MMRQGKNATIKLGSILIDTFKAAEPVAAVEGEASGGFLIPPQYGDTLQDMLAEARAGDDILNAVKRLSKTLLDYYCWRWPTLHEEVLEHLRRTT